MPRNKNSLKHDLFVAATKDVTNNQSRTAYKRACKRFTSWAKQNGIKQIKEINEEIIQKYHDSLKSDPRQYTAATIHSYLAPICKAARVNMSRIRKEKRTSDKIVRGRKKEKNEQGKRQELDSRFTRIVAFQKVVGIRRNELRKLKGKDLVRDSLGNYYIVVQRGKGGKRQHQLILPQDVPIVLETFRTIAPEDPVFSKEELANLINFHGMRAQHARDSYSYFLSRIAENPDYKKNLKKSLIHRWEEGHQDLKIKNIGKYNYQRRQFINDLRDDPYFLRGTNAQKARQKGAPTTYNRLALMAVSVFMLSHWRLSVTVTNYIL